MGNCTKPNTMSNQQPCHICLQRIQYNQQMQLHCAHKFHKSCLVKTYETRIYERNFPLKCPDCSTQVTYFNMKSMLPDTLSNLYEKILLINALLLDEHIFFCPTPDCPAIYQIIPSQFRYFQCLNCKKQHCLICHKKYHGKTQCNVDNVDLTGCGEQPKVKNTKNSIKCPRCKSDWFKTTGCNIVDCKVCNKSFCYQCGGDKCGHNNCLRSK